METTKPIQCKPCFQQADQQVSLSALADVISQKNNPAILGGNESVRGTSIFTADPVEVFEFCLNEDKPFEKLLTLFNKYCMSSSAPSGLEGCDAPFTGGLRTPANQQTPLSGTKKVPTLFCGGWMGYFGYELGRFIEKLPGKTVDNIGLPVIRLAFYDKAILYDHDTKTWTLAVLEFDGDAAGAEEKFKTLTDWLLEAVSQFINQPQQTDMSSVRVDSLVCNMTQEQYFKAIGRIKEYIIDGDTYQINFSQRFEADFNARPIDLFHWQNTFNPSPYAAFLAWDDTAIVSASPELFLQVNGDTIVTKPIKGTRPRNPLLPDESPENHRSFVDLVESKKDQAELAMIVDLERNDLARICVPGTRHVTCRREIEAFPTVYHAAGGVEGQLRGHSGLQRVIDILKAMFPGGSITGAPKIRSMEIIDELEPTARGIYTGSIGWIGMNFDLCWNIAIRTVIIKGNKAYIQTGGGIVADSVPEEEWAETLTKARALLAGIEAVGKKKKPTIACRFLE